MDKKIKKLWVKALLSGEYKQGTEVLFKDGMHCCMGVLVHVVEGQNPGPYWCEEFPSEKYVTDEMNYALALLNDDGVPFDMIAGLIDEAL